MSHDDCDGGRRDMDSSSRSILKALSVEKPCPASPPLPRVLLWKRDLCQVLGVGPRTVERMISSGEIPAPDRRLRGRPAWLSRTVYEWAENGCPKRVQP